MTVDGAAANIGQKVDPTSSAVAIDGVRLPVRPDLVYYLVYKPVGVLSTARDPQGRPVVTQLVPETPRVHPVGRLDVDSEGLILLTNDGDLTNRVTHPRYGVGKTYVARVEGRPRRAAVESLKSRIDLEDGPARAAQARIVDSTGDQTLVEIVMTEGRKREVRRMMDAIGHPVIELVRTAIGPIRDPKLKTGTWRELTIGEVRALYSASGAAWHDAPAGDGEET